MATSLDSILGAELEPEIYVRRAMALLESELRRLALWALADWADLEIPAAEIYPAVAGLQRPSWGSWNGLLGGIRAARRASLRSGDATIRARIEESKRLDAIFECLDRSVSPATAAALGPLAELARTALPERLKVLGAVTLPIPLRNRVAHDNPSDRDWWSSVRSALSPLLDFVFGARPFQILDRWDRSPPPWFIEFYGKRCVYNGLADAGAALYVSAEGISHSSAEAGVELVHMLQRLLGKTSIRDGEFRSLLGKLAPEEVKGVLMGDFLVGRPLGSGGYGTVHLGRQLSTGRAVAIKLLHDGLTHDMKDRFKKEAAYQSLFTHRNIVGIFGYGEETWFPPRAFVLDDPWFRDHFSKSARVKSYIAMEWVAGRTLEEFFKQSPRPDVRTLSDWLAQAAQALAAVHAAGLIHRDVKPSNLMVTDEGTIKLMDFGIARSRADDRTLVTTLGRSLGTPAYMSPEQIDSSDPDGAIGPASDVYSLCATFYELFTGTRLYRHDTTNFETVKTAKLTGRKPEPPRKILRGLPWEVETILLGGLENEPSDRYQSAESLEQDVRRFLSDQPILYRRPGLARRCRLAYRRNRMVMNLIGCFLMVAIVAAAGYLVRIEQKEAQALVRDIEKADTANVLPIIDELARHRFWAEGLLRDRLATHADDSKEALHLTLALRRFDPRRLDDLSERLLKADPVELLAIRTALRPSAAELAPFFWHAAEDDRADVNRRFRAGCALADYDPTNVRWLGIAPVITRQLVSQNVLLVGQWRELLQPVRSALVPPLLDLFRQGQRALHDQELAARLFQNVRPASAGSNAPDPGLLIALIALYAADNPTILAEAAKEATAEQFAHLFPTMMPHAAAIAKTMLDELREPALPEWRDAPLDPRWRTCGPALTARLDGAAGLIVERFALCQTLPLGRFDALAAELAQSGYRPICFRPYASGPETLVAALWTRDGQDSRAAYGLRAEDVPRRDAQMQSQGYWPRDVASYEEKTPDGKSISHFAVLWVRPEPSARSARLAIGLSANDEQQLQTQLGGFLPRTLVPQAALGGGAALHCGVWWMPVEPLDPGSLVAGCGLAKSWYERKQSPSRFQLDVRLTPAPRAASSRQPADVEYSSVWRESRDFVSEDSGPLPPQTHLERCRQFAKSAYRPVSLSVVSVGPGQNLAASVWHRPSIPQPIQDARARRQAIAAVTLLRFGRPEAVWPLLSRESPSGRYVTDPRRRTYLVHYLGPFGADPREILRRLSQQSEASARRALILCLGEFPPDRLGEAAQAMIAAALLPVYRQDLDANVHSAVDWLLRQWGYAAAVDEIDAMASLRTPAAGRRWYVNSQRQTMVLLRGPITFKMGSPGTESERFLQDETMHERHIPRSFAVAVKKVTAEQFLRFNPKHNYSSIYCPTAECPIVSVTWFDAAKYCQWLSEKDGIARSEWCYPDDVREGMQMPDRFLSRTGYRLPTEAEWEYACRAEAETSRCYGESRAMLGYFARTYHNAVEDNMAKLQDHAWPVGQLKPNDFGLFDAHGNVWDWCEDRFAKYPESPRGTPVVDAEDPDRVVRESSDADRRVLRGGSFVNRAPIVRSASRNRYRPKTANYYVGLRVARTLTPEEAARSAAPGATIASSAPLDADFTTLLQAASAVLRGNDQSTSSADEARTLGAGHYYSARLLALAAAGSKRRAVVDAELAARQRTQFVNRALGHLSLAEQHAYFGSRRVKEVLRQEPDLAALREDPRFQNWLNRLDSKPLR